MDPTFHLAELYTQASLSRRAYSALPDAPVRPSQERPRRRWGRLRGRQLWPATPVRRRAPVECLPAP